LDTLFYSIAPNLNTLYAFIFGNPRNLRKFCENRKLLESDYQRSAVTFKRAGMLPA